MLRQARLDDRERRKLRSQLEESARPAHHSNGTKPPYVLLPLLPYLPKEWVVWENSGQGFLAEGLRKLNGNSVIESKERVQSADVLIAAPRLIWEPLQVAYETLKPFALFLPLDILTYPQYQKMFQGRGLMLIIPDRPCAFNAQGFSMAWFAWSLPGITSLITYAHIPGDEHLLQWMYAPTSRAHIRKG